MKKIEVPLLKSNRLINFGPVVLVTSSFQGKNNIVSVAWVTPISHDPPLAGISVAAKHFSNKLIKESREFVINIPGQELKEKVEFCGSVRGENIDKFKESKLTPKKASKVKAPLIDECLAHLECRLEDSHEEGDHTIFIGEIISACAAESFLNKDFVVDLNNVKPLQHLGGSNFGTLKPV